jgi:hypothetical protein
VVHQSIVCCVGKEEWNGAADEDAGTDPRPRACSSPGTATHCQLRPSSGAVMRQRGFSSPCGCSRRDAFSARVNLMKKKIVDSPTCELCGLHDERRWTTFLQAVLLPRSFGLRSA